MEIAGQDYADGASFRKRIQFLRQMTGEQRLRLSFEMWQTACEIIRAGIRAQHPEFSAARRIMSANGVTRLAVQTWLEKIEQA